VVDTVAGIDGVDVASTEKEVPVVAADYKIHNRVHSLYLY